jgi:hypothetical protein
LGGLRLVLVKRRSDRAEKDGDSAQRTGRTRPAHREEEDPDDDDPRHVPRVR